MIRRLDKPRVILFFNVLLNLFLESVNDSDFRFEGNSLLIPDTSGLAQSQVHFQFFVFSNVQTVDILHGRSLPEFKTQANQ